MWPAFIDAARESLPGAKEKIAFDKCHVAKYLGKAVDRVRRQEHKASMAEGREDLKGSKYDRLYEKAHRMAEKHGNFRWLRESAVKTVRAWARQGIGHLSMGLCQQDLGAQDLETAAVAGHALSSRKEHPQGI
uniref:Transposase n=1 Tax=Candidatus Kentrum sp. TC TaxID=2126339 RepID=A0A450YQT1_9GAMM|nr:MAG: Transposase [Candidatus Kentron sp. TC]